MQLRNDEFSRMVIRSPLCIRVRNRSRKAPPRTQLFGSISKFEHYAKSGLNHFNLLLLAWNSQSREKAMQCPVSMTWRRKGYDCLFGSGISDSKLSLKRPFSNRDCATNFNIFGSNTLGRIRFCCRKTKIFVLSVAPKWSCTLIKRNPKAKLTNWNHNNDGATAT